MLQKQIELARRDANTRVSKGSDLGIVGYTRSYLLVFGTLIPLIVGLLLLGSVVNMKDPVVGVLFTGLMVYSIKKLVEFYEAG